MRGPRTFDCADCGAHVTRTLSSHQSRVCQPCAADRSAAAVQQLHDKSGPYWDKYLAGQLRYAARLIGPA